MKPHPLRSARRPAPLGWRDAADPTAAVHRELADTDLCEAGAALSRVLHGIGPWVEGAGPIRFQRRGLAPCQPLREAVSCLQLFLKGPVTPDLRAHAARECRVAADRLDRHGAPWTAAAFAEAACTLQPHEPWHALEVARLAVRCGRPDTAWGWLLWAAGVARDAGAASPLAAAVLEMGNQAIREDRHALAGRLLVLAAKAARLHERKDFEGEAVLTLGLLRHDLGYVDEALAHFAAAVDVFGPGNPRLLPMGCRVAERWLDEGQYQAAAHVLHALASRTTGPLSTAVTAGLARACAALGWEWHYEAAWSAAWERLGRAGAEGQAAALLQLVRAAVIRRHWARALTTAATALRTSMRAGRREQVEEAARMVAVLGFPKRQRTREVVEEAFPDLARLRRAPVVRWIEEDPPEPWQPTYPVRTLVDALVGAVRQCPKVKGLAVAL
jgi:hypothetical protein